MNDQEWNNLNNVDTHGNPAGGYFSVRTETGYELMHGRWQDGPLGRGEDRGKPNGIFVETMMAITRDRIQFYESAAGGRFSCAENQEALEHIDAAMAALNRRTERRESEGVEGTHEGA